MPDSDHRSSPAAGELRYRRIVAKFGTNLLTAGSERLDLTVMASLVGQVAALRAAGAQILIVTSGAIAAGRHRLGGRRIGKEAPQRQMLAAVGQSRLMQAYDELFAWHSLVIAQTLLTRRDLADRQGYLNARNTLLGLLDLGVIPIINENDVVAIEEIGERTIGDNDTLSALVANLVDADLLAILTDIGGLYTRDPRRDGDASLIPRVERVDEHIERLAGAAGTARGRGGMLTKVRAAALATASGVDVVIADGRSPHVLPELACGGQLGTLFPATAPRAEGRRRFLLADVTVRGRVVVDEGARRALVAEGRSLLPAGVRNVSGNFERGDAIDICGEDGVRIARGITNYAAPDIEHIMGMRSDRLSEVLGHDYGSEVVHRNNLVLLTNRGEEYGTRAARR
ncbi:MAG TPA: glutamate 5-kinase [Dehalococcoidia bacterium]|nr:glutamate 5-kinase [Dehalococcoidia bacterium]